MESGQPAHLFAKTTFREMEIIVRASGRRDAHLAWLAAQYGAIGFHKPGEMPPDPLAALEAASPVSESVSEEIRSIRRRVKLAHDTAKARGQNGS